ncbi:hypothetical protein OsI_33893 [Oryza sativa Indica Group]|uniref:Uncharacterized protein n=1 Tax=Oryza sativa subsp. indica TaxID=39946 RepID=A2Z857_ORYSI|nr:hypothetical protein OsI_33893 [Oryza sativa Indica Group]
MVRDAAIHCPATPLYRSSSSLTGFFLHREKVFLALSLLLLAVEFAAYLQGWHLEEVALLLAVDGLFAASYVGWMRLRLNYLTLPLQFLTNACVFLFMVQSIDHEGLYL